MAQPITTAVDSETALFEETRAQTECAYREFVSRVSEIPDITVVRNGRTLFDRSYTVYVPSLWSDQATRVHAIEGDMFRQYPLARLDVHVSGQKPLSADIDGDDASEAETG